MREDGKGISYGMVLAQSFLTTLMYMWRGADGVSRAGFSTAVHFIAMFALAVLGWVVFYFIVYQVVDFFSKNDE